MAPIWSNLSNLMPRFHEEVIEGSPADSDISTERAIYPILEFYSLLAKKKATRELLSHVGADGKAVVANLTFVVIQLLQISAEQVSSLF
jgi:hypothetical protein